jgi:exodeoxyribonuclease V gamma subunit
MIELYHSNSIEILADKMIDLISAEPLAPLHCEIVSVPNIGLARWLPLQFCRKTGVAANIHFPFPASFVWKYLLREFNPLLKNQSSWMPDVLRWRLYEILPQRINNPEFVQLKNWSEQVGDENALMELAAKIADLFDQYIVYRPQLLENWQNHKSPQSADKMENWQQILWLDLIKTVNEPHRATLLKELIEKLRSPSFNDTHLLPNRLNLFAPRLPEPLFIPLLDSLGKRIPLNIFVLNPCQQYWELIVAPRTAAKASLKLNSSEDYQEVGTPILALNGKQHQTLISTLNTLDGLETELFSQNEPVQTKEKNMLQILKSDILDLADEAFAKHALYPKDHSIQIHSCHSPVRELEILHQQLLAILNENTEISPADIQVIAPEIDSYAPWIESIFQTENKLTSIPIRISSASGNSTNLLINVFLKIISLIGSRYNVDKVLAILEADEVCNTFGIDHYQLPLIKKWINDAGIRWGIDASTREKFNLPPSDEFSWKKGLERLLLGYAFHPSENTIYSARNPLHPAGDQTGEILGPFISFMEALFDLNDLGQQENNMDRWADVTRKIQSTFLCAAEGTNAFTVLCSQCAEFFLDVSNANYQQLVPFSLFRELLSKKLSSAVAVRGTSIDGAMQFSSADHARTLPAKVLCFLGLNQGCFPGSQIYDEMNLMLANPCVTDQTPRDDDRAIFLDSILSAKEVLYLSYTGQSQKDNSPIPPSVVVSELTDYLESRFEVIGSDKNSVEEHIVHLHPLQAFSNVNFDQSDERIFSFSTTNLKAAKNISCGIGDEYQFAPDMLALDYGNEKTISLSDLSDFFRNPAKYILQRDSGISLPRIEEIPDSVEPFSLDGLQKWKLRSHILDAQVNNVELSEFSTIAKAREICSAGKSGTLELEKIFEEVKLTLVPARVIQQDLRSPDSIDIDVCVGQFQISGRINNLYPAGTISLSPSSVSATKLLPFWLEHLLLFTGNDKHFPKSSSMFFRDSQFHLKQVDDAEKYLLELLDIYINRAHYWQELFVNSSYSYLETRQKKSEKVALAKAVDRLRGSEFIRAELDDPWVNLLFRGRLPLQSPQSVSRFTQLAESIWSPFFKHVNSVYGAE